MRNTIISITLFLCFTSITSKGQDTTIVTLNNLDTAKFVLPLTQSIKNKKEEWEIPFQMTAVKVINNTDAKVKGIRLRPFTGTSASAIAKDTTKVLIFDLKDKIAGVKEEWRSTDEIYLEVITSKNDVNKTIVAKTFKKDTVIKFKPLQDELEATKTQSFPLRYPFYDALLLKKMYDKKVKTQADLDSLRIILCQYAGVPTTFSFGKLKYVYKNNLFISNTLLAGIQEAGEEFGFFQSNSLSDLAGNFAANQSIQSKVGAGIGNLNVTMLADAFAKIIVKRFKQDLNEVFFEKMKDEMDKCVELRTLFPRTHSLLNMIDRDIYNFEKYIEGLRQKVEEDLANTFANTTAFLETEKYKDAFEGNQPMRGFIMTVSQFADGLVQGDHPGQILENLRFSDAYNENDRGKNIKANLQTLRLLSKGLQDSLNRPTAYWINGLDSLHMLFKGKDEPAVSVWLGLLYQLAVDEEDPSVPIVFGSGKTLRDYINSLYSPTKETRFDSLKTYIQGLMQRVNAIERSCKDLNDSHKKNQDGKVYWDQMVGLYENAVALISYAPNFLEILDKKASMPFGWYQGIRIANILPRIYAEMHGRQYNAAIQHVAELIQAADFRKMYLDPALGEKGHINDSIIYRQIGVNQFVPIQTYDKLINHFVKMGDRFVQIKNLYIHKDNNYQAVDYTYIEQFLKYGTFAASLALAKTSDEVAQLIESTMSPPGSSRIKDSGKVIGINSYFGFQGAADRSNKFNMSVSAPIGVNFSFNRKWKHHEFSGKKPSKFAPRNYQFLFGIVDLGALTAWRLTNDTAFSPKIVLSDIVAPGIFVMLGRFGGTPLNISAGIQSQPRLFKINDNQVLYRKGKLFRANINLSWDIPFWNISHKPRAFYKE